MHEMSLCESMLKIVEQQAAAHGAARVRTVRLAIGALSCASPDALRFCFDAVTRGTVADRAALEIDRLPGRAWCSDCTRVVEIEAYGAACPVCGGHVLRGMSGEEMRVTELEVE